MKLLLKPYSVFITITLPQLVLVFLFWDTYKVLETELQAENIDYWWRFGIPLGVFWTLLTGWAIYLLKRKRPLPLAFSLAVLLFYIPFLYLVFEFTDDIIPPGIPRWMMVRGDVILLTFTILMPALVHALLSLVVQTSKNVTKAKAWLSFATAVGLPLFWYISMETVFPMMEMRLTEGMRHFFFILMIGSTICFLFFLLRAVYLAVQRKQAFIYRIRLAYLIPVALVFPVLGLLVNQGLLFGSFGAANVFGDFTHPAFYIVAVLNGLLVCFPENILNVRGRMILLGGRAFTFPFILYFFVVFIPFLPLSLLAILFFGLGFLMLVPLVLFVLQLRQIVHDYESIRPHQKPLRLNLYWLGMMLILPALVLGSYVYDRTQLNAAMTALYYQPLDREGPRVMQSSIKNVLAHIRGHDRGGAGEDIWFGDPHKTPILSAIYKKIVLDDLTLSFEKEMLIRAALLGEDMEDLQPREAGWSVEPVNFDAEDQEENSGGVILKDYHRETKYNSQKKQYESWLHLEVENVNDNGQEYETEFRLPPGVYISNYYLDIADRRAYGILAEKQSATWIYNQITVVQRRDPGLLGYLPDGSTSLKVFPVPFDSVRTTGIQLVHAEPFTMRFDGKEVRFEEKVNQKIEVLDESEAGIAFVPAEIKAQLPKINRRPYFHFIIDASQRSCSRRQVYIDRVKAFIKDNSSSDYQITVANYRAQTAKAGEEDWDDVASFPCEGGMNLDMAILQATYHYLPQRNSTRYPVFILVTDSASKVIWREAQKPAAELIPEGLQMAVLEEGGKLLQFVTKTPFKFSPQQVLAWPSTENVRAFLRDDGQGQVAVYEPEKLFTYSDSLQRGTLKAGMVLNAQHLFRDLHPERGNENWLNEVKGSFAAHILTPFTSFISVETEAQKRVLADKQQQRLNGSGDLDITTGERPRNMSEPPVWILVLLLALAAALHRFLRGR